MNDSDALELTKHLQIPNESALKTPAMSAEYCACSAGPATCTAQRTCASLGPHINKVDEPLDARYALAAGPLVGV